MNPEDLIICTPRSRWRWLLDAVLTAIAWVGFGYLCATGILAILEETRARVGVPFLSAMLPTMGTLSVYVVVGLVNSVVLLAWALYNQFRFAGLDRRKPIPALQHDELARSFGLPPDRLEALHCAKVAIVAHEHDGTIADVYVSSSRIDPAPDADTDTANGTSAAS